MLEKFRELVNQEPRKVIAALGLVATLATGIQVAVDLPLEAPCDPSVTNPLSWTACPVENLIDQN